MQLRLIILFIAIATTTFAANPPQKNAKKSFKGDSTSYIYFNSNSQIELFKWENNVRLTPKISQKVEVSPIVDTLCTQLIQDTTPLFIINTTYQKQPLSLVSFEINDTEYLVGIPIDNTSYRYLKNNKHLNTDTLIQYTPFETTNINNCIITFYGKDAWQINIEDNTPERFYINLNSKKSELVFQSEIIIPLVLSIILILISTFYTHGYLHRLWLVVLFYNAFTNAASERNISAEKSGWILLFSYLINISVFAYIVLIKNQIELPFGCLPTIAICIFITSVVFITKLIVSLFFSNLFICHETCILNYTNIIYILQILGVVLLPINICLIYIGYDFTVEFFYILEISILIFAELIKLMRLFKIIFDKHFSTFYLFLYLCGVEFLPVLLAVKILSR